MMPFGPKMDLPWGSMFYIGLYRSKHERFFLSETIFYSALIFGIKHLVDLYKVCSNYSPGPKMSSSWGHMFHIGLYRENMKKNLLICNHRPRALICGK